MPIIAVINRKGGSGKSTLATHLAAYCAHQGLPALLGDADFQQSSHAWLRLRDKQRLAVVPRIVGWTVDPKNVLRAPTGITHIVLDTPGGLKGYELLRLVMLADAVLLPVCHSMFDRESAAECLAELQAHPRVLRGRCRVAAVGMRVDSRTKAEESLRKWAGTMKIPFLGALRETQTYVKCLDHGLTIFDMPAAKVEADLAQWQPILQWLRPLLMPTPAELNAAALQKAARPVLRPGSAPSGALRRPAAASTAAATSSAAVAEPSAEATTPAMVVAPVAASTTAMTSTATEAATATTIRTAIDETTDATPDRTLAATSTSETAAAAPQRRPPSPADEDLDSRFGFSTRIGRWLEMLSMRRAR